MNLLENARRDWLRLSQADFAVNLTLISPADLTVQILGLATTHNVGIDPETGTTVNTKNSHCSFSEKLLTDLSYPVRDTDGDVSIVGHEVKFKDSTGTERSYLIDEAFPDETVGFIVCILGDKE